MSARRFPFRYDRRFALPLRLVGATPERCWVEIDHDLLHARFGRLSVRTPLSNVAGVTVTGPFKWFKAIGPRLSLADRGVTFGSSTHAGVCVRFHEPVPALMGDRVPHPGLTVTVADPEGLAAELRARAGLSSGEDG